jgi:ATP-dependent DNA helicase RecG
LSSQLALDLKDPLTVLPGIGPGRAAALRQTLRVANLGELLRILPRAYEEPGRPLRAADFDLPATGSSDRVRLRARVLGVSLWPPRGRRSTLTVRLECLSLPGPGLRALYFNQPYLKDKFPIGRELWLEGRLSHRTHFLLIAPRVLSEADCQSTAPAALYPEATGVPPEVLRKAVRAALPLLEDLPDPLPSQLLKQAAVPPLAQALRALHLPRDAADLESGRRRLALDEVMRLEEAHRQQRREAARSPQRALDPRVWERIRARLPFPLNAEQEAALELMRGDLARGARLQRLLHGEVGSGKTAVAFALALAVIAGGGQVALLAPTEILARQHLSRFRAWLAGSRVPVIGLLGDDPAAERRRACAQLRRPDALLVVGTHALFGAEISFARLRLVIFDEQHRFGVKQKAALLAKGRQPHVLTMTATPIPRTLAWARYGALDSCVLRSRAGAGAAILTTVHDESAWLQEAEVLRPQLAAGSRAFFVAARIDGPGGLLDRVAQLRAGPWRGLNLALVHGRLRGAAVAAEVERFTNGEAHVLCGTTVVEVGLDLPGVEHMMVCGAERLGLASLHQLRGRLARGPALRAGRCMLFAPPEKSHRLRLLEACSDGFQVAEADLAERGPGSLRGTRQHGASGFRLFDPGRDHDLVELVRTLNVVTGPALPD